MFSLIHRQNSLRRKYIIIRKECILRTSALFYTSTAPGFFTLSPGGGGSNMCQTLSAKCSETQCADVCSKAKDQYDACDLTDKQVPDEFMWKCTAPALAPGSPAAQAGQSYTCFVPPEAKFCDPACSAFWQKAKRGLGPAADKFAGIAPGEEDCAAAESVEGCCGKGALGCK